MRYQINRGVIKEKVINVKKLTFGIIATFTTVGAMAAPALASNSGTGADYGTMPGYTQAQSQTQCSGAGAFNALGKNASLGTEKVHAQFLGSYPGPGTDGQQTATNNSTLCGNPQGH
jgi:hypothetical protein